MTEKREMLCHFLAALAYRTQKALRTHAGQIAMLRRLFGSPVAPENFVFAHISPENLTADQPPPANTDRQWREAPEGWKPPE